MKARPLCFVCLIFLIVQSILLIVAGGGSDLEIPASSIFREEEGKTVYIQGQVYKKSYTSNIQILYLKNNSVKDSNLLVYDEKFIEIPIGKTVLIQGKTALFERARNPGNYDPALYYARENLYGVIWCETVYEISGETDYFLNALCELKMKWKEKLIAAMGEENGNILAAMLLGDKAGMDADIKELYQRNGIGHVLAISGLHISFIGLGIYRIIRKTGLPYWAAGLIAIGILSLYVLMLGYSISVFRAYIMLLLKIGADLSGRVYDMPTALLLSAALTIGKQPLYLTDAAFYLSYGAILGILCVLPALQKTFRIRRKRFSGLYASLAINFTLFPILLWYYYEIPMYSVLINLLVIPLMSIVLGLGMIGSVFLPWLEAIGKVCLIGCGWILNLFEKISQMGAELPMARLVLGRPDVWKIVIYYMALFLVTVYAYRHKNAEHFRRAKKYLFIVVLGTCLLLGYQSKGDVQITMLDVGQGDGIYIKGPNGGTYFIDGGSSDVKRLGKYRIEPYLKSQGVGQLDYVFISHGDADHYSGIEEMLERQSVGVKISVLVLPCNFRQDEVLIDLAKLAQSVGTKVMTIKGGDTLQEGNLSISCLQPAMKESLSGNAGSVVLEICYHEFDMLCTGDVEAEGEELLIQKTKGRNYDVLKVAHHGSQNSTSQEFLEWIHADIALISAGKDNRYGHPHEETIKRLQNAGCRIYETDKMGAITLKIKGNSLTIWPLPYRL